jgi:pimeloyl-ACP methyl ester carboxylesterase
MSSTVGKLGAILLAALICTGILAPTSGAQIAFAPCPNSNSFACAHLNVPLDPSGGTPGEITLTVRRRRAPVGEAKSAVVALAGGPGQSALPFAEVFSEILGPILSTRDLIVYDQRGTGLSHPLSCHAFETPNSYRTFGALIESCANQIGPTRAFYTTPDSVADIEAIRKAGGYEKLVLYGTSYGTKVALQYAQEYPEHVEALILDSVPRILRQLCAYHQCAHITRNPVRDLARLVRRMRRGPVRGRVVGDNGRAHTVRISSNDLIEILLAGDFNPILRAEFIGAVRAASTGDDAALARLLAQAGGGEGSDEGIDVPLYYATTCEEEDFPWSRTASPSERIAQASAQLDSLPAGSIAPFTRANALALSGIRECAFWPFATAAPPVDNAPLPNVPTLLISGADDLRTPTSGARAVAAQIPSSHVIVVPNTGHSVLTTEPTSCALKALHAMFAGKSIVPCPAGPPVSFLRPTPLAPRRLADVSPAHGYHGRAGRTLHAVQLTLADFARQLELKALEALSSAGGSNLPTLRSGGLRAGWAAFNAKAIHLHGYSYVPGVTLTGTIASEHVSLRVSGSAAAHGILRLGAHRALVGALGSHRVHLAASGPSAFQASAAPGAADASAATPRDSAQSRSLERLEDVLGRMPAGLGAEFAELPSLSPLWLRAGDLTQ